MTCTARIPNHPARRLALLIAAFTLTACTSSSGDAAEPATTAITTTSSSTSTSTTSSAPQETTAPPSTTQPTSEPAWTEEELVIIEAYRAFENELVEVLANDESDTDRLRQVAANDLADALVDLVEDRRLSDIGSRGTVDISPLEVTMNPDGSATLRVCRWGQTERIEAGEVTVAADPEPVEAASRLVLESDRWKVEGIVETERSGSPCEL